MSLIYISPRAKKLLDAIAEETKAKKAKAIESLLEGAARKLGLDVSAILEEEPKKTEEVEGLNESLRFWASEEERAALQSMAKSRAWSMSQVIRWLIQSNLCGKEKNLPEQVKDTNPKGDDQKGALRCHLSLTGREKIVIEAISKAMGLKRNTVILSILRAYAFKNITFTWGEIGAIVEAKNQLRRIGANMNQAARALNISLSVADQLNAKHFESLAKQVKGYADTIQAQMQPMIRRWGCRA
jgi:hypothetical protein